MGLPEWKGGTAVKLLVVWLCIHFGLTNDLGGGSSGECNMQPCWELYETANRYYQPDRPLVSNQAARKCVVLRTYKTCLSQLKASAPECTVSLNYQGSLQAVRNKFSDNGCDEQGPIYPEGPEPERTETIVPCKFNGRPIYNYCTLFGDPHLVTFSGEQMTCRLEGAWPLVDNRFLTIQVTNAPLPAAKAATVTQKVTVVVKGMASSTAQGDGCGSPHAVFYHAEIGSLPTTFSDGLRDYGEYNSIKVNTIVPGEQVEIYLRYIDSTVTIRQIDGQYLSVGVRIPEEVLNGTVGRPDRRALRQLCLNSCPSSERVDISRYLAETAASSPQIQSRYASAQAKCRTAGVTDFFFDSCVFDMIMTEKESFSSMASSAYKDVRRYASRQPRWTNRTSIEPAERPLSAGPNVAGKDPDTSAAHSCCLVRTLLFVYIMHVTSLLVFT